MRDSIAMRPPTAINFLTPRLSQRERKHEQFTPRSNCGPSAFFVAVVADRLPIVV